jgi:hypothetical protein
VSENGARRVVRLTARASALLFSAAQAASALPTGRRFSASFYLGFMAAHAVHFAAVTRYARLTGGTNLFPGGRSMADVGGWPTVIGIYTVFSGLALTGWVARRPTATRRPWAPGVDGAATTLIAALFVGTYLGQARRSSAYVLPAVMIAGATIARLRRLRIGDAAVYCRPPYSL